MNSKVGDLILTSSMPVVELDSSLVSGTSENNYFMKDGDQEYAGKHYIIDFWGLAHAQDVDVIEAALKNAADAAEAVLLHVHLHKFSDGGGVTGVALLAESHISVHTWPERDYAAFDVFMCGGSKPEKAVEVLKDVFSPERVDINEILRGKVSVSL